MNFLLSKNNLTLHPGDGSVLTIPSGHPKWDRIVELVKKEEFDEIIELMVIKIPEFLSGNIEIKRNRVFYQGNILHNAICDRMMRMHAEGFDIEPMSIFLRNMMQNPSQQAINGLYKFLEVNQLPITPDGHFIGYRTVREDWMDGYSQSYRNKPGDTVMMDRASCDPDPNNSCSHGLHIGGYKYFNYLGTNGHVIACKVHPADVVAVPDAYDGYKLRCCRYQVIEELDKEQFETEDVLARNAVYDASELKECPECEGEGTEDCLTCDGEGVVERGMRN